MGIGVLPSARKQGRGGAITRALVRAARSSGVTTAFLSAGSDDAASVYRAVGFERVGTACILELPKDRGSRG
jgi:N-acetylglutamate synthase-like GNAT family acetyltransferase